MRVATFLAPSVFPVYKFITEHLGRRLGIATELVVGESFGQFARGELDAGFICGLPYVQLADQRPSPVELLAAPVLLGERYGGQPVYFSDVIVHAQSPYRSFAELRGASWSFNDPDSHSGYGLTRYTLTSMGETRGFFGRVLQADFHQESIRLVHRRKIDASAIDSQVLELAMREQPELRRELRVIDTLGPSTIQPVVAATHLPASLRAEMSQALIEMAACPHAAEHLAEGLFERFVPVSDATYDDIRRMLRVAEEAGVTTPAVGSEQGGRFQDRGAGVLP